MATNANIKDATSFPSRTDNLVISTGKTVGNAGLARLAAALAGTYAHPGGGAWPVGRPDANDAAAWLWGNAAALTKQYEDRIAKAAVTPPSELTE